MHTARAGPTGVVHRRRAVAVPAAGPLAGGGRRPGSHPFRTSRGVLTPAWRALAGAVALAGVMVLSSLLLPPLATVTAQQATAHNSKSHTAAHLSVPATAAASAPGPFYGGNPSSEPLSSVIPPSWAAGSHRPASEALFARLQNTGGFLGTPVGGASTAPASAASSTRSAAPTAPPPATSSLATASGTVECGSICLPPSSPYSAISGALITPNPIGAQCPNQTCAPVYTSSSGTFTVNILQGADQIQICAGYYVCNYTVLTNVTAGKSYSLGVLYLVPCGLVSGVVEGNDTLHEKVAGVQITGSTRDLKIIATPSVVTGSTGTFTAPVPPGPSELQFSVQGLYFGTTVFVDVQPGQVLNLGVVALEVGVVVTANIYDRVTLQPVPHASGFPPPYWAMQACARDQPGLCFPQGMAQVRGYPIKTVAPPGADTLSIESDGYITNVTNVYVPYEPPGVTINVGKVYITPDTPTYVWSNLTWQSSVQTARTKWGTGLVVTSTCSLDGYQFGMSHPNPLGGVNLSTNTCSTGGCTPVNTEFLIASAPLRDSIHIFPDTTAICNFFPTWPIPGLLPVSDNWTWVNATPGRALNVHGLNLTPGTYVEGTVLPDKTTWSASACSQDAVTVCFPGSSNLTDPNQPTIPGCPSSSAYPPSETFCAAVPPGPFQLKVVSPDFPENFTEGYNPPGVWNSLPLPLSTASANGIGTIRLAVGHIAGRVLDALTHQPIQGLVVLQDAPAGLATYPSDTGVPTSSGYFFINAPPGWDALQVRAPNYNRNGTTVYVAASTVNVGTIYLTPLSFIEGQVLGPQGYPINTTSVQICSIVPGGRCQPVLGGGLTNTNGSYYLLVTAGHYPVGSYEVVANAPGYLSNSTWVNVLAPGTTVVAPTLYLYPLLGSSAVPRGFGHAFAAAAPSGAWVYGRVVDNTTDQGLPDATIDVVPVGGGTPSLISGQISTTGFFNFTQSLGHYWMNFSDPGFYYPASYFVDVNGSTPAVNLGTVRLVPLTHLSGRLEILPWSATATIQEGVAPQSTVRVCTHSLTFCGASAPTDSGGFFNVSAPVGRYDQVSANGIATGTGTAANGFLQNHTYLNVTTNDTSGSPVPFFVMGQTIFATYTGLVRDSSTHNRTPVRWGTAGITSVTPGGLGPTTAGEVLTGGGGYTVFLAPGNITVDVLQGSAWVPARTNLTFTYGLNQTLNTTPSKVNVLPTVSLQHFGWIEFNVTGTVRPYGQNSSRIPFGTATASVWTKNGTEIFSSPAVADGWGFVNMSAPPGANVTLAVTGADFNISAVSNISVNSSATTVIGGIENHFGTIGNVSVIPWGWIGGVVWDPANQSGVPLALITTIDNASVSGAGNTLTNELGQYLSDLPLGNPVQLSVAAPGYITNNSVVLSHPGTLRNQTVNLTGMAVVAGRVLGYPGLNALYQAFASVCPEAFPQCTSSNGTTNGTGYFWVVAKPGIDVINVSIPGYALNGTPEVLDIHPDTWVWAGTFVLSEYATVTGVVLGNPSGQPLYQANVSMCSVLALPNSPTGPCFETVKTNDLGQFSISTPPGNYILAINYTSYNASYYPISLTAGELVTLGTVLLEQYGALTGTVLGADSDAPVAGTLVRACPVWSAGNCTPLVTANGAGRYAVAGPPGTYVITASAPGYQDSFVDAAMVSGTTTTVLPIFLTPVGTNLLYSITGTVTGGTGLAPLAGAVVSAGADHATATNSSGGYDLTVPWGIYLVSAQANGYTTESRILTVHQNQTGIDFVLPQAVYTLSGTTRDGLTGNLVPNVEFYSAGTLIATSDQFGSFSVALSNGSYTFTTRAQGSFGSIYAPVTFSVGIDGASATRNVQLFPIAAEVYGLVVNSLTGAPVANATVVVDGATQDSYPESATYHTGALGTFVAPLFIGSYAINASASGYLATGTTLKPTTNATMPVTLSLTPVSVGGSGNGGGFGLAPVLVIVGIGAVGVAAFVGLGRLRTSGPEPVRGPGTSTKRV